MSALLAIAGAGACSAPKGKIVAHTTRDAAQCASSGRCLPDPTGLAKYNPVIFTENLVLRNDLATGATLGLSTLQDDPYLSTPVVLIAEELEPHLRGAVIVSASDPCGSPLAIKDPKPTLQQLRSLRDGQYKTCLSYVGESMERKVLELEPVTVDATSPAPSGTLTVENITTAAATVSWASASDNLTTQSDLSYQVYTSTAGPMDSVASALANGSPVAGRVVGGTLQALSGLSSSSVFYVAIIVTDEAGNHALAGSGSFSTASASINVTISPPSAAVTRTANVSFDVSYTGVSTVLLTSSKITINKTGTANATATDISGSGMDRTVTLTGITGDGTLGISIQSSSARDAAGYAASAAGPSATFKVDNTAPLISLVSTNPVSPGNTRTPQVIFTLNEATAAGGLQLHGNSSCSSAVSAATTGIVGANTVTTTTLAANSATSLYASVTDTAGNNSCRSLISYTHDGIQPGVAISSNADPGPTNLASLTLTFEFSENVTGFAASDVSLTNATAGTFTSVDANTYTLVINPSGSPVSASVPAGSAVDAAQNGNTVSNSWSVVWDNTAPSVSLVSTTPTSPASTRTPQITFTLNEATVAGGLQLHSNSSCSSAVSAATTGIVGANTVTTTTLAANNATSLYASVTDAVGNNACRSLISYTHDGIKPGVTITSAADPGPTNQTSLTLTIEFTENVTDFTSGDVSLTNATAGPFSEVEANIYTLLITATGTPVQASIAADVAIDSAQNGNSASNSWSIVRDTTTPTISFTSISPTSPNDDATPDVTINLSEASSTGGLRLYSDSSCSTALSAAVTGGTGSNTITTSTIAAEGSVTIHARMTDLAGNQSSCTSLTTYILANICTWTGAVSTAFTTDGNWTNCASAPSTNNQIIVPSAPSNQPVLSANRTIRGFAEAAGGGTITVNSGVRLTVTGNIESSIAFKGSSTTCSNCVVYRGTHMYVQKDATLTLMEGITLELATSANLYLGDGTTSAGHLATNIASSSVDQWPLIGTVAANSYAQMRLFVQGTSTNRSRLSINGLRMKARSGSAIFLKSYYEVDQLDKFRVAVDRPWNDFWSAGIEISTCTGAQFDDTSWTDLQFADVNKKASIETPATTCASMPTITVSGSGLGYGEPFETDPANKISWTDGAVNATACEWTGSSSTDWSNAGNWTSCSGGVPNQMNWVVIPSAPANQPRVSGRVAVYGFAAGTGGGTVSIAASSRLNIIASSGNIQSNVTLKGDSTYCPTCEVGAASGLQVTNGATLTMGTDVTVRCDGTVKAGVGTSAGHITAAGGSDFARWPSITKFTDHGDTGGWGSPLTVQGTTTVQSKINFDGLKIHNGYSPKIVDFKSYYEIVKLDNVYFDNNWSQNDVGAISLASCTGATITATTWNNIYFDVGSFNTSIRNIDISHASCSGIPSLTISGRGIYYGDTYETDTHNKIAWSSNSCSSSYTHRSHCWYLSDAGESCTSRCSANGGVSPATMYAGNAFGRGNEHQLDSYAGISCSTVLTGLVGASLSATTDFTNTNAIGCSVNGAGTAAREFDLKPTADAVDASYKRACACGN